MMTPDEVATLVAKNRTKVLLLVKCSACALLGRVVIPSGEPPATFKCASCGDARLHEIIASSRFDSIPSVHE